MADVPAACVAVMVLYCFARAFTPAPLALSAGSTSTPGTS
jgi:hypothetical protein